MNYQEYRQAWTQNPKDHILSRFPLHLDIELNTDCNLHCKFCPNHSKEARYPPKPPKQELEWGLYKQIITEGVVKGLCAVKLCFRGEPLLYNNLALAITYAKKLGVMDVMINTNALLLDRAIIMDLMLSHLDKLIVSDYGLELQVHNLEMLKKMKHQFKFKTPYVIVHSNESEKWEHVADEIVDMVIHDYNSGEECIEMKDFECEQLWQRLVILANGDVKMCCTSVDFPDGIIGNVKENTIEELWHGEYLNYVRWCHMEHVVDMIKSCRFCPGFINYKNKE